MQARLFEFLRTQKAQIVLCEDDKEADELAQITLYKGLKTFVLPDFRASFGDDLRSFSKELFEICRVLNAYHKENASKILISPIRTLLHKLPSKANLANLRLQKGEKLDINTLKDEFVRFGYEFVDIVQDKGEASFRGDIIDIFSIGSSEPVRILLFDDEVESIRHFNLQSQKSVPNELEFVEICPFLSAFSNDEIENLQEKISEFDESVLVKDINSLGFWCVDNFFDYLSLDFVAIHAFNAQEFERDIGFINERVIPEPQIYKDLQSIYSNEFFSFHKDKKIIILANSEALLKMQGIELLPNMVFVKSPLRVNLISPDELIVSLNKKDKVKRARKATLIIDELQIGDFIVHQDYGVGKFLGLEMIKISSAMKEFVALSYQNGDKLLLPVENLHLIDKYIGVNGGIPQLDKLGKSTFLKLKEKLKERLFAIASQIVELAAKRALIKAQNIRINLSEQLKFASSAGFDYTSDQEKACEEVMKDLQSGRVMDRLLSADVGFGKTEVAMNAIFPAVQSGFCVFFFVPTTLLSHQHYKTLVKRFAPFGISVHKLDRFTSAKEKKLILDKLAQKQAFVLIGTHALLSVRCENLGLVVIDEEHKFGVKQKEKLKEFSQNSHILSMSATPIPRSLNQALSGVKTYSTIQTPPQNRLDVRTFVKQNDDNLIKEAILRELRRGGQVFFNHIASIEGCKVHLQALFANVRILVLHSKIDAKTTEEQMLKFENKDYDIMLCTSIVESGIDLPNVNTIIVENAERFGMADLHQLRGRVGRSDRQGYCYFLVDENLSDEAKKRLVSLESNSFLGAGSILAYHDLEIRGGGNLLGSEQSGHIEQIGYSLYLKMLEEQIAILSKKGVANEEKIDLKLGINAFLNSELITHERLRLELYRRLSKCQSANEVYEIQSEIEDRFGTLDTNTKQFLEFIIIKILASKEFKAISNYEVNIALTPKEGEKIIIKAPSKDDDDILDTLLIYLRKRGQNAVG